MQYANILQSIASLAADEGRSTDFYTGLSWTADGTSLISPLSSNSIQVIVVPADLLESRSQPHKLEVYCSIATSEPIRAVRSYPKFDLQDGSSALVLMSVRDLPIQLTSALTAQQVASYPLVSPTTEEYICPHALCFTQDGGLMVAGSESLVSVFDVSRPGQEPLVACRTGPRHRNSDLFNPTTSIRGIISALDIDQSTNILAAGTLNRQVGLYSAAGQGECIGTFSVAGNEADKEIQGQGITQVRWSTCGRYLYVAERKSDGMMVYDVRNTRQLLSWPTGRQALTNQRLSFNLYEGHTGGQQIWAGGIDGKVRRWDNPQVIEGGMRPSWEMHSGRDAVSAAAVHQTGAVLATCSGSRAPLSAAERPSNTKRDEPVTGINIWELPK
jgi:telomerase Cajal body protein 1